MRPHLVEFGDVSGVSGFVECLLQIFLADRRAELDAIVINHRKLDL
jgi:hypothetical protein